MAAAVLALALSGISPAVFAAARPSTWLARSWQTDDGLLENSVNSIVQTRDGYLWVASDAGLTRFNGVSFDDFSERSPANRPWENVRQLHVDRVGRLWVATSDSVTCLDSEGSQTFQIESGGARGGLGMAEDTAGNIWLAGQHQVGWVKEGKFTSFDPGMDINQSSPLNIAADRSGNLWLAIGSKVGVCSGGHWMSRMDLKQAPICLLAAEDRSLWICAGTHVWRRRADGSTNLVATIPDPVTVNALLHDDDGTLWIGTSDGLYQLQDGRMVRIDVIRGAVRCLFRDREGNLWVGTSGSGLNLLRPKAIHIFGPRTELLSRPIRSICEDRERAGWAVLMNGWLIRDNTNKWQELTPKDGWTVDEATCATAARNGGIWIGTQAEGLWQEKGGQFSRVEDPNSLPAIRGLLAARDGSLWVAAEEGNTLAHFQNGTIQKWAIPASSGRAQTMVEDNDGSLWVGTSAGSLLEARDGKISGAPMPKDLRMASVKCLYAASDGSLWAGFEGHGLGRLRRGKWSLITTREGLFDDKLCQIEADDFGSMWLTGLRGLFRVEYADLAAVADGTSPQVKSTIYGRGEGIMNLQPSIGFTPNSCKMNDGKLWFATYSGFLLIKRELVAVNKIPPPVVIERVVAGDHPAGEWRGEAFPPREGAVTDLSHLTRPLALPLGQRDVRFDIGVLSFASPENVQLRYRLRHYDSDWRTVSGLRSVLYPRLVPGDYVFEVQACNNEGIWNRQGSSLSVVVPPFYWESRWFQLLAAGGILALVVVLVRHYSFLRMKQRLAHLREQAALQRERARIARDIHDEVGAKLSRLLLLSELVHCEADRPGLARSDAGEISRAAREALHSFGQVIWSFNPRNDSLSNFANYLCSYAADFFKGSGVECLFDVPILLPDLPMTTEIRHNLFLAIKEALNNTLRHAHAQQVMIRLRLEGQEVTIEIEDDGCGLQLDSAARSDGNGLDNMRFRVQSVGGQLKLDGSASRGTTVIFSVPLVQVAMPQTV